MAEGPVSFHELAYLAVPFRDEWLVVFRGQPHLGESAKERTENYWPRVVCACADRHVAEDICDWLEARLAIQSE
jgi:hypothetical protein